jgi:hypothetical protein
MKNAYVGCSRACVEAFCIFNKIQFINPSIMAILWE